MSNMLERYVPDNDPYLWKQLEVDAAIDLVVQTKGEEKELAMELYFDAVNNLTKDRVGHIYQFREKEEK